MTIFKMFFSILGRQLFENFFNFRQVFVAGFDHLLVNGLLRDVIGQELVERRLKLVGN
jgi:hypothetical protein